MHNTLKIKNFVIDWSTYPKLCYDPTARHKDLPADFLGFLRFERIPPEDRIFAFAFSNQVTEQQKRGFMAMCARDTITADGRRLVELMEDPRSLEAIQAAERYSMGQITLEAMLSKYSAALEVRHRYDTTQMNRYLAAAVAAWCVYTWTEAATLAAARWAAKGNPQGWEQQINFIFSMMGAEVAPTPRGHPSFSL